MNQLDAKKVYEGPTVTIVDVCPEGVLCGFNSNNFTEGLGKDDLDDIW